MLPRIRGAAGRPSDIALARTFAPHPNDAPHFHRSLALPFALGVTFAEVAGQNRLRPVEGRPSEACGCSPNQVSRRSKRCRPAVASTFSVRVQSVFSLLHCSSR